MASTTYVGPNRIIGEIYSSGWFNYIETFENRVSLDPIQNPAIKSGTLHYRDISHQLIYNEIVVSPTRRFEYRGMYIPKKDYTTTILLYGTIADFKIDNGRMEYNTTVRNAEDDSEDPLIIILHLSEDDINKIDAN